MSKELKAQAQQWYVRMRSPDVSEQERRKHRNWLTKDASHQEAYAAIEQEWRALENLEYWAIAEIRQLEQRIVVPKRSRNIFFGFAGAVLAAISVAALVIVLPMLSQNNTQRYETVKGEQRKIVLEDGSRIYLNSASSIVVRFSAQTRKIDLLQGEGMFDVEHEQNRPFVVGVAGSRIVAVGTSFSVHYKKDDIAVTVVEGRVAILPAQEPEDSIEKYTELNSNRAGVLLEHDRQVRLDVQGEVADMKIVDAAKLTAWNRGLLIFDGMPLREVSEEISRYIVGNIQVAEDVPDYPVTGVIKIQDQETMLQLLSEVVPITPVKRSPQLTTLYASTQKAEYGESQ